MPVMLQGLAARKRAGLGLLVQLEQPSFDVSGDTGVIGRFSLLRHDRGPRVAKAVGSSSSSSFDDSDSSLSDSEDDGEEEGKGGCSGDVMLDMKGSEMEGRLMRGAGTMLLVEIKGGKGSGEASVVVEQVVDHFIHIDRTKSCLDTLAGVRIKGDESSSGDDSDFEPSGGRRRSSSTGSSLSSKAGRGRGGARGRGRGGKAKGNKKKTSKAKAKAKPKKAATVSLAELQAKRKGAKGEEEEEEEIEEIEEIDSSDSDYEP